MVNGKKKGWEACQTRLCLTHPKSSPSISPWCRVCIWHWFSFLIIIIASAMDNRESTAGLFLDLRKAFDAIDQHSLLNKLDHYGIRGHSFNWVSSYLTDRKQLVQFTSACSQPEPIVCGIPQGWIVGPLLFIIYINDLPNASNLFKTFLFSDVTSFFILIKILTSSFVSWIVNYQKYLNGSK